MKNLIVNNWKRISIIFALILLIIFLHLIKNEAVSEWVEKVVIPVICSLIAGLITSILVEIPDIIGSVSDSVSRSLTNDDFLNNFKPEKLKNIEKKSIRLLYPESKQKNFEGFWNLNKQFCDILLSPYYKTYKETHKYIVRDGITYRESKVDFELICNTYEPTQVDIGILKYFPFYSDKERTKKDFTLDRFIITIDDGKKKDITKKISTDISLAKNEKDINKQSFHEVFRCYVKGILTKKNLSDFLISGYGANYDKEKEKGIYVEFSDKLIISYTISQPFSEYDTTYIRRDKFPAEDFFFESDCPEGYNISGSLLGPFKQDDHAYNLDISENSLHLDCKGWMLPGDGIVVAFDKKVPI